MKLTEVTNEDGIKCARLLTYLKTGTRDLTGAQVEDVLKWVQKLAVDMAAELKSKQKPVTSSQAEPQSQNQPQNTGIRIKSMGMTKKSQRKTK